MLCDDKYQVKLADFGLAKCVRSELDDTAQMVEYRKYLTPGNQYALAWWAPECIGYEHVAAIFSTESDVYALGMVMWQCLAGQDPFSMARAPNQTNDKAVRVLSDQILSGVRPDLEDLGDTTPPEMVDLMNQCWKTNPQDRPSLPEIVEKLNQSHQLQEDPPPAKRRRTTHASARQKQDTWSTVDQIYQTYSLETMRKLALKRRNEKGSYLYKRWIANLRKTVHLDPPKVPHPMADTVFDTFLIHTGAQKEYEVKKLQQIFDQGGFESFLDKDMETDQGPPRDQMACALETSRYSVVVLSQAFLERKHPREELAYAFKRMQWIRKHYNKKWHSLWVILFDVTVSEYNKQRHVPKFTRLARSGWRCCHDRVQGRKRRFCYVVTCLSLGQGPSHSP